MHVQARDTTGPQGQFWYKCVDLVEIDEISQQAKNKILS